MINVQFFAAGVQKDTTPCIAAMFVYCFRVSFVADDDSWGFPV